MILNTVQFPPYLHGGIRDPAYRRGQAPNARPHLNKKTVVTEDIKNFFPTVHFSLTTTTGILIGEPDQLAMDLFRLVFFAMNWPDTADDPEKLSSLVRAGSEYNLWRPTSRSY